MSEPVEPEVQSKRMTGRDKMFTIIGLAALLTVSNVWNTYKNHQVRMADMESGFAETRAINRLLLEVIREQAKREYDSKETLDGILDNRVPIEIRL